MLQLMSFTRGKYKKRRVITRKYCGDHKGTCYQQVINRRDTGQCTPLWAIFIVLWLNKTKAQITAGNTWPKDLLLTERFSRLGVFQNNISLSFLIYESVKLFISIPDSQLNLGFYSRNYSLNVHQSGKIFSC